VQTRMMCRQEALRPLGVDEDLPLGVIVALQFRLETKPHCMGVGQGARRRTCENDNARRGLVLTSIFGTILDLRCETEDLPVVQIKIHYCPERRLATHWLQVDMSRPHSRLAYAYSGNSVRQAGLPWCFGDPVPYLRIL
jgi:hypothetical protein